MRVPAAVENQIGKLARDSMQLEMDALLAILLPAAASNLKTDGFLDDAGVAVWAAYLKIERGFAKLRRRFIPTYLSAYNKVSKHASLELKRILSVDVGLVIPGYEKMRKQWADEGVELIQASDKLKKRINKVILDNPDVSANALAKLLREVTGIEVRRAELIARDQILKAYGRQQQLRQKRAGVKRYIWTTVKDGKVRRIHQVLEGTTHTWAKPPVAARNGVHSHPGQIYQCRCTPYPILDD